MGCTPSPFGTRRGQNMPHEGLNCTSQHISFSSNEKHRRAVVSPKIQTKENERQWKRKENKLIWLFRGGMDTLKSCRYFPRPLRGLKQATMSAGSHHPFLGGVLQVHKGDSSRREDYRTQRCKFGRQPRCDFLCSSQMVSRMGMTSARDITFCERCLRACFSMGWLASKLFQQLGAVFGQLLWQRWDGPLALRNCCRAPTPHWATYKTHG